MLFWYDTQTGHGLAALLTAHWEYGARLYPARLKIVSKTFTPHTIPEPAISTIRHWLYWRDLKVNKVHYANANGQLTPLNLSTYVPDRFIPPKNGPSFDCHKARSNIEHALCDNPRLAKIDLKMGHLYRVMHNGYDTISDLKQLKALQVKWIRKRNRQCSAATHMATCLKASYKTQIKALNNFIPTTKP